MNDVSTISQGIRRSRFFCSLFFLGGGLGIGAWASSLPVLSIQMNLDKGQLGLVLICFALGAISMMTNIGRLAAIVPSSVLSLLGSITFGATLIALPYVGGVWPLAAIVFLAGAGFGTLDVSMNIDASALERRMRRQVMSSFHAVFSFGSLAGAFAVGQILSHGGALSVCLGVTGAGVAAIALVAWAGWNNAARLDGSADAIEATDGKFDSALTNHLYLLGGLAFLGMLAEGGMMDWSAIYIVTQSGGAESTGAYGFAAFATMMATGRLFGDVIANRIGQMAMLSYCAMICAGSVLVLILMGGNLPVVLVALTVCGLGLANVVPTLFAAAGRAGGASAARAMSIVTTMGYAGLLLGPGLLGLIAHVSSLAVSFCVILLAFIAISVSARSVRRAKA
ncbi:MFS transporter [Mesorhizobium sp. 113-3-3]|uniref:MFS transporter n=1 Tax=Mesorhizobium sp. 113-3-3 TaxID=2744516 RepID=UPI001928B9CA|nr:MFS transporter [Mesorhizobium sp. 113-3-3]